MSFRGTINELIELELQIMKEKKRRFVMAVICGIIILSMVLAMLAPMFA